MKHAIGYLVLALVMALTGCRLCQNPWAYCASVIGPSGSPNCDFGARANSAFHPMDGSPSTTPVGPTAANPGAKSRTRLPANEEGVDDAIPAMPDDR